MTRGAVRQGKCAPCGYDGQRFADRCLKCHHVRLRDALETISGLGCERLTTAAGCAGMADWSPDAALAEIRWCSPCTARAALGAPPAFADDARMERAGVCPRHLGMLRPITCRTCWPTTTGQA